MKFTIKIDEKNTIWGRYHVEIEAESLEEAKEKALKVDLSTKPIEWLLDTAESMSKKENACIGASEYLLPDDNWEVLYGFDEKNINVIEIVD